MAGGNHFLHDPAIERWAAMRENVYQHFKFTPKTTRTTVFLGVIVPAAIFGVSYLYDNQYDWTVKTRGESLLINPPPAKEETE